MSAPGQEPVRGALITLEGLDRSGKTTQVTLLEQRLTENGRKVKMMRFPGEWIRKLRLSREQMGHFLDPRICPDHGS